jgi:hypothetical protein
VKEGRAKPMTATMNIMLVTALRAAETLAAYHRQRADMTLGEVHDYHLDMARRCLDDIEHIKRQLADGGVTLENQDLVLRQRDVAAAQRRCSGDEAMAVGCRRSRTSGIRRCRVSPQSLLPIGPLPGSNSA